MRFTILIIISYFIFFSLNRLNAQNATIIKGQITDSFTKESIPFANVYFKGTTMGTMSNIKGTFYMKKIQISDTLVISVVGYIKTKFPVRSGKINTFEVKLKPIDQQLGEIVVHAGVNPALQVLRNVIKYKSKNNPILLPQYTCDTYTRVNVGISNIGNQEEKNQLIERITKRIPGKIDSSGKKFIPLFVSEKLVTSTVETRPVHRSRVKIKAKHQNGVLFTKDMEIEGYVNSLSTEFNFYKNYITIFEKPFVSPLASSAFLFYEFYLLDSAKVKGDWIYRLKFKPRRIKDLAFIGELKVNSRTWALTSIHARILKSANINYLNKLSISFKFRQVNDSTYFFERNKIKAQFFYTKLLNTDDKPLLDVRKTTLYRNVRLIADFATDTIKKITIKSDLLNKNLKNTEQINNLMIKCKAECLAQNDGDLFSTIDSINRLWWMKQSDKLANMFTSGYYNLGKIDFGPYLSVINRNKVENWRFTLLGRTAENFSSNFFAAAKIAYGFRNKQWQYGAKIAWKFNSENRQIISLGAEHFMSDIGANQHIRLIKENMQITGEDGFIASLFHRSLSKTYLLHDETFFALENQWNRNVSTSMRIQAERIYAGEYIQFNQLDRVVNVMENYTISSDIRLVWQEKTSDKYFRRYHLGSKFPIIHLVSTYGHYVVGNQQNNYFKFHSSLKHKFNLGIGLFKYVVEGGYIFGKVPFPVLDIQRANLTYGYSRYSFNLLNKLAVLSDKYISFMAEYHANGLILNSIPLIKNLNLREVFSSKILYSQLGSEHNKVLNMPVPAYTMTKPYIELGAGIENIFQFICLEYIWRVSSAHVDNSVRQGIRIGMQFTF